VQTALDAFGRVDVIINNAGILRDTSFKNMSAEMVDPVIDVHLRGAFNVTKPAWSLMREQGYGRIVTTTSGAGLFGNFGQANYGAAKMGLVGLTRVLAVEGAKFNITANAIAPLAMTRMTEDILAAFEDRLAPSYISPLVAYLVSDECEATGRVFSVGGGRVAEVFFGETMGFIDEKLSPESVRDHWTDITDRDGYVVPRHIGDETQLFMTALG
jgi:NAD(P)-dependent dehydrogenase (short-subunit alcohol dehydrogenase family)